MADDHDRIVASRQLVIVLNKYSEVLELQLLGIRETLATAVQSVMSGINEISHATDQEAREANKVLEKTYFNPDDETKEFINTIQNSVDELLSQVQENELQVEKNNAPSIDEGQRVLDNRLRRFAGQFSKHMEALSTMDAAVGQILFRMMAALSSDDVIGQRLQHLLHSVHALEIGLSYVLLDISGRFSVKEIEKLKADLLAFTYKQYTMEGEKDLFKKIFGEPPKSASQRFRIGQT